MEVGVWWLMSSELLGSVACVCMSACLASSHWSPPQRQSQESCSVKGGATYYLISWLPEPRYQMPETGRRGQRYH